MKPSHRKNQPPTGRGKHQPRRTGAAHELEKRSEVVQARHGRPDLNLGDSDEEFAWRSPDEREPRRKKAGR